MPFIHVRIQAPVTDGQISQLQHEITALMERVLGKRASLTSVLVDVSTADWSIGGETVQIAAHMQRLSQRARIQRKRRRPSSTPRTGL